VLRIGRNSAPAGGGDCAARGGAGANYTPKYHMREVTHSIVAPERCSFTVEKEEGD